VKAAKSNPHNMTEAHHPAHIYTCFCDTTLGNHQPNSFILTRSNSHKPHRGRARVIFAQICTF